MVQTPSHPPAIPAVAVTVSMPSAMIRQTKKKIEEKVTATGGDKGLVEQARSGHRGTRAGPKPRRTAARAPQGIVGVALTGAQGKDVEKKRRSDASQSRTVEPKRRRVRDGQQQHRGGGAAQAPTYTVSLSSERALSQPRGKQPALRLRARPLDGEHGHASWPPAQRASPTGAAHQERRRPCHQSSSPSHRTWPPSRHRPCSAAPPRQRPMGKPQQDTRPSPPAFTDANEPPGRRRSTVVDTPRQPSHPPSRIILRPPKRRHSGEQLTGTNSISF